MNLFKIIRRIIGVVLPVDPEKERVMAVLLERLDKHEDWELNAPHELRHKEFNIQIDNWCHLIEKPESMRIPFRWRSHVADHFKIIRRMKEVNKLQFIHDVVSGKYVYQRYIGFKNQEYESWLKENGSVSEYIIREHWLYISDETLAMAFKLTFD